MTVYVVTSGQYSDYEINGLFSSKEKAEEFIAEIATEDRKSFFDTDYHVEQWPLDVWKKDEGRWVFVFDNKTGNVTYEKCETAADLEIENVDYVEPDNKGKYGDFCCQVSRKNREDALKIASEKFKQFQHALMDAEILCDGAGMDLHFGETQSTVAMVLAGFKKMPGPADRDYYHVREILGQPASTYVRPA